MGNIKDKTYVSKYPPKSVDSLWYNGKEFKIFNNGKWNTVGGGSGGGINVVDSVDKLDPNAPAGSIAAVATQGSRKTVSFKDLVQPDADIMDMSSYTVNTEGLSVIDSVEITLPDKPISANDLSQNLDLGFCTENFSLMGSPGIMGTIQFNIQDGFVLAVDVMVVSSNGQESLVLFQYNNGNIIVNEEDVNKVINLFNNNKLYYLSDLNKIQQGESIEEGWWPIVDSIIRPTAGIPSEALIYLKKDNWEPYLIEDFKKALNKIDLLNLNKQDKITVHNIESVYTNIQPNTYNIIARSRNRTLYLPSVGDADFYEIIIEFTNTGDTSFSIDFSITINWANNLPPVVQPGQTIIMSIVRGFGVWSEFIKE